MTSSPYALPFAWYVHTHWDREWYATLTTYSVRLLGVLEQCLHCLETHTLAHVVLDGQTSLLEDVLQVTPDAITLKARLERLITTGRLSIGPWYVMPDSFLCHPVTLKKNLSLGIAQAKAWGQSLETLVGYLPDTFGHPSIIPQLLTEVGIRYAVVWRGVKEDTPSFFYWQKDDAAPSAILTLKLTGGYFQPFLHGSHWWENEEEAHRASDAAQDLTVPPFPQAQQTMTPYPCVPKALEGFLQTLQASHPEALTQAGVPPLLPVGGDHLGMPVTSYLQALQKGEVLAPQATSLYTHMQQAETALKDAEVSSIPVIHGHLMAQSDWHDETTPSAPALLTGVWSSRLWLKQWHKRLEWRLIVQLPEALQAWERYRSTLAPCGALSEDILRFDEPHVQLWLAQAWKLLLQNTPHDTLCGCSIDAVHQAQAQRYQSCEDLLNQLYCHTVGLLHQHPTHGCYEPYHNSIEWAIWHQCQVLDLYPEVRQLVWHEETTFHPSTPTPEATHLYEQQYPPVSCASWYQQGKPRTHLEQDTVLHMNRVPLSHRWAITQSLPYWYETPPTHAYAYHPVHERRCLTDSSHLPETLKAVKARLDAHACEGQGAWLLENAWVGVKVHPSQAQVTVTTQTQTFQLVLMGVCDAGDSYNRGLEQATLPRIGYDITGVSQWERSNACPALAKGLTLTYTPCRTHHPVTHELLPTLYLHLYLEAHSPVLHTEVSFENTASDWRLQCVWVPEKGFRPESVTCQAPPSIILEPHTDYAQSWTFQPPQYTAPTKLRPLKPWREWNPLTFPVHTHFSTAYGMWFSEGLTEWEYFPAWGVDATQATQEAFGCTLHRGFGWLSHPNTGTRDGNAGPYVPTLEGQGLYRTLRYRFAYASF
ncbi:MAG: hypothetical protein ACKO37_09025 [Vampirovibrionales bacterium]